MIPASDALIRLRNGNARFVSGVRTFDPAARDRAGDPATAQRPFAAILGCSDSRVPVEIVFDQGPGDLFVIRVAGNIVAPSQVGSVEFAADRFSTRLVVVLGHTRCGAVQATVDELQRPGGPQSSNISSIVDRIRPAVEGVLSVGRADGPDALVQAAVRANVRMAADHLRHGSDVLERLVREEGLLIVGAEYSLESGEVDFFDGVPPGA